MSALREVLVAPGGDLVGDVRAAMRIDLAAAHRDGRVISLREFAPLMAEVKRRSASASAHTRVFDRASYPMSPEHVANEPAVRRRPGKAFEIIDRPASQEWDRFAADKEVYARQGALPFRMHLYDAVAYVAIDFDDLRAGAFRIRDPGMLADLERLFVAMWSTASPMSGPPADRDVLEVVRLLISGLTDESAAQRLGVSLRTYRRRIAALMVTLGVDNRFAAGVEADRRGLVALAYADSSSVSETA